MDDERSSGERDTAVATWKYSLGLIHRKQQQRHVGVGFGFGGVGFGDDDAREDDDETDDGDGARGSRARGVDRDVCERQAASVGERER